MSFSWEPAFGYVKAKADVLHASVCSISSTLQEEEESLFCVEISRGGAGLP